MDVEEGEAKMCRLCGQYERIYIDVFGEEGVKRYLGHKIYRKINILIDERDPLPKAICVQCLGKLEFVCDFQEECLRTQQVLRDRYNLPPLTESAEVKNEEPTSPAGASSTDNNNSIETNLNSTKDSRAEKSQSQSDISVVVIVKDSIEQKKRNTASKTLRSLRSQQQQQQQQQQQISKYSDETNIEKNVHNQNITETSPIRWLRSRQSADSSSLFAVDNEEIPIANRLRSHNNVENNINARSANGNSNNENTDKQSPKQQQHLQQQQDSSATIQLPTSTLNKLLTIVSNSPDIEVSVKEMRNRNNDAEDISFTVELCQKQNDDVATVRARIFPDQSYCLVDTAIVNLLQNDNSVEINGIINGILSGTSTKNGSAAAKLKDLAELEQQLEATQNPEELFKIDGEEIKVDDNVEHVVNGTQNGYACKLCRKFYERRDKCTVHVKTHLGIKQYTCVVCNAKFVCKSDVMKHIRCSHTNPRPIQCPKCPKRFKSKFYLAEHDNVHKGVRPYSCTDCGQSYHHKVSLQIHMKSHLPPQNLACEYCGKVFPFRTRLLGHIASVHMKKRRNFRCRFCYNLYSSLSVLNEHIKTRHATTYTCETCSKTFKVASKYKAHVLQHSNPKPFACHICNNRYASKAFLNEHLLKHEGLRKHVCQECGASFAQASHLAAHRHVHGEKTHACPECGKKFNRRDNMKVHRKRHFEEKKTAAAGKQKGTSNDNDSVASTIALINEK
ncbi:zinc finger protein 37-like [Nylanderia fulva]|uniref:zinc finger protein 37-like n=1 Tax=Nylanderia fulva TaxID=613905 RepID=UPI0010FB14D5|nr:zinc finger protein 37-like [Nylanderia fulva]